VYLEAAPSTALITTRSSEEHQQMTVFDSAAGDYFRTRRFQGLQYEAPSEQSLEIKQGQYGIAASYERPLQESATSEDT
jgi:hypothetical protein